MNKPEFYTLQKRADEAAKAHKHIENVERLILFLSRYMKEEPTTTFRFYVTHGTGAHYSRGVDMEVSPASAKAIILPELRKELARSKGAFMELQP